MAMKPYKMRRPQRGFRYEKTEVDLEGVDIVDSDPVVDFEEAIR